VHPLLGVFIAYLAGSIPFAYLAGKARGVDLRQHGSGNLGATNAMRVMGTRIGMTVYVADTLKGLLPVIWLPRVIDTGRPEIWAIAIGVAAIVGHVRPVFLMGQGGGKGVATAGGVFFGLAWLPTFIAFLAFVAAVAMTQRISVGSITAAIVLPAGVMIQRGPSDPLALICAAIALLVIWLHRGNIRRLIDGTEPRMKRGASSEASP
jgi:acyl phosphate:glycerol-3-phosphate acyltransferase